MTRVAEESLPYKWIHPTVWMELGQEVRSLYTGGVQAEGAKHQMCHWMVRSLTSLRWLISFSPFLLFYIQSVFTFFIFLKVNVICKVSLQLSRCKLPSPFCVYLTRKHHKHTVPKIGMQDQFQEQINKQTWDWSPTVTQLSVIQSKPAPCPSSRVLLSSALLSTLCASVQMPAGYG